MIEAAGRLPLIPAPLLPLFEDCRRRGGRALLVGGSVRDALLGRAVKDFDIEVHDLEMGPLVEVLRRRGRVNEVGRSFGVLKVSLYGEHPEVPGEVDVSVPRRDSREGPGHRGIRATADPGLGVREAARRRDLTVNAIAWDPLQERFEDPFGGIDDLAAGLLRAVDVTTFGEDPLRALRVAQFAARFEFAVDPALEQLCRAMPLEELPAERIRGEVEKLLLRARRPSVGWELARRTGAWAKVLPEWDAERPDLDRCAASRPDGEPSHPRRLALLLAAASTGLSEAQVERVLDRLWVHRVDGYAVRRQVQFLVKHESLARGGLDAERCRRLAELGDVGLLCRLADREADLPIAEAEGVLSGPLPTLIGGKELGKLGVAPGPRMGELLASVREAQLAGRIQTRDDARAWVSDWLVEAARQP